MKTITLLLAFALTAPEITKQDQEAPPSGVVCGLGAEFHAGRRAALAESVGEGVLVFRGQPDTRAYLRFQQDKTFWWLTGIESPNVALVIDTRTGEEVLFLPKQNLGSERWEGEKWDVGDEWVAGLTGFSDIRQDTKLVSFLKERLADKPTVWISKEPHVELAGCYDRAAPYDSKRKRDPLDGRVSREQALEDKLIDRYEVEVKDCQRQIADLRKVKTAEEIEAMRIANDVGVSAMIEGMRATKPGVSEWELDSLMSFAQRRLGAAGPAYEAIVGSGANALILHYISNHELCDDGELLLVDFAPEVGHYITDITRTWPVNGKFTERQAEIYDCVLAAQNASIAAVRPGVTIRDVQKAAMDVIEERGMRSLVRHGFFHFVGMEVHDVGGMQGELEVGMAFTIEPGLYEDETSIGVRIEDVVVVTEDGCINLSAGCPRGRAEIEALVGSGGLLEAMDAR
jgi:Xaa-Pro aminopeptidase